MSADLITWRTERRKVADLKPFPGNPRRASEKQVADLDTSLERFNVAEPLVINTDGTIIGGNFRTSRLRAAGIAEVDVRVPSRTLTDHEAMELNLRLNKNTAEFDFDVLGNIELDLLKDVGFTDFDLGLDGVLDKPPELSIGDRSPCRTMNFTVSANQEVVIKSAIKVAIKMGGGETLMGGNDNKNGNALAFICDAFFKNNGHG